MKVNASAVLVNLTGEPLKDGTDEPVKVDKGGRETAPAKPAKNLTLGIVVANTILHIEIDERNQPVKVAGVEQIRRFRLAQRFYRGGTLGLRSDDVTLAKASLERAISLYSPLVIGQALDLIEPSLADIVDDEPPETKSTGKVTKIK